MSKGLGICKLSNNPHFEKTGEDPFDCICLDWRPLNEKKPTPTAAERTMNSLKKGETLATEDHKH